MSNFSKLLLKLSLLAASGVVLAGCLKSDRTPTQSAPPEEETQSDAFTGSFYDLLARGLPLQCRWSTQTEQGEISGQTYVAGEKMRSETTMPGPQNDAPIMAYSIFDNAYLYSWTSQSKTGTKMKKVEPAAAEETPTEAPQPEQDFNQKVSFDCQPWAVDEALFVPPADITFQDMTQKMEEVQKQTLELNQAGAAVDACQICQQIPDDNAKQQCLNSCQ